MPRQASAAICLPGTAAILRLMWPRANARKACCPTSCGFPGAAPQFPIRIAEIRDANNVKLDELEETVRLRQQGRLSEAMDIVLTNRGKDLMDWAVNRSYAHQHRRRPHSRREFLAALQGYMALQRAVTAVGGVLAIIFSGVSIWLCWDSSATPHRRGPRLRI